MQVKAEAKVKNDTQPDFYAQPQLALLKKRRLYV
jgi:hypothetical protein